MADVTKLLAHNEYAKQLLDRMDAINKAFYEKFMQQQKESDELIRQFNAKQAPVRVDVQPTAQQPMVAAIVVKAEKLETERKDFVDLEQHESQPKALSNPYSIIETSQGVKPITDVSTDGTETYTTENRLQSFQEVKMSST